MECEESNLKGGYDFRTRWGGLILGEGFVGKQGVCGDAVYGLGLRDKDSMLCSGCLEMFVLHEL